MHRQISIAGLSHCVCELLTLLFPQAPILKIGNDLKNVSLQNNEQETTPRSYLTSPIC